jgi:hypothetical protein
MLINDLEASTGFISSTLQGDLCDLVADGGQTE